MTKFWKGTVPRLGRLIVGHLWYSWDGVVKANEQLSGGIIFTVYEKVYPFAAMVVP